VIDALLKSKIDLREQLISYGKTFMAFSISVSGLEQLLL
jgi:hypothetical protein